MDRQGSGEEEAGDEIAFGEFVGGGAGAEEFEEEAGGAAVFAVGEGDEGGGEEAEEGDGDAGQAGDAEEVGIEGLEGGVVDAEAEHDVAEDEGEEDGGEGGEELVCLGRYFNVRNRDLLHPLLEGAVWAEVVAVELVAGGPGDDEGGGGEEEHAEVVGPGDTVLGPAGKEGLGEEIAGEEAEVEDEGDLPEEAEAGAAAEFGEGHEKSDDGEADESELAGGDGEGWGRSISLSEKAMEPTPDAFGEGPTGVGGTGDALDAGFFEVETGDLFDGPAVELAEVLLVFEDTLVVLLVVVAFAETKTADLFGVGVEEDECIGGALVSEEAVLRGRGTEGVGDGGVVVVGDELDAFPVGVGF